MLALTGEQKAAILLISLGVEHSAKIIRCLNDSEIEQVTAEMANVKRIPSEVRIKVLEEFEQIFQAQELYNTGGLEYARGMLERALGAQRAKEILDRLVKTTNSRPFESIRRTDPKQLAAFLQGEHPQTIALIIAHLVSDRAATVLAAMPPEIQPEVSRRIALMGQVSPEIVKEVEGVLKQKLDVFGTARDFTTSVGGIKSLVDVLNRVDQATVKNVLDALGNKEPDLAEKIKGKMFVFEDIVQLDDRAIQQVLRQIETREMAVALKGASDAVAAKIQKNMSSRAAVLLKEDMDYMGPVRLKDVEEAQEKIIKVIRQLEESGEIIISRGGQDEIIY